MRDKNLLAAFKRSRSISQQPVRSPPFCRLVIHLDNITAMKRSTHSAGAHASHDTNGQKKKIAMNYMNKLRWNKKSSYRD